MDCLVESNMHNPCFFYLHIGKPYSTTWRQIENIVTKKPHPLG